MFSIVVTVKGEILFAHCFGTEKGMTKKAELDSIYQRTTST